MTTFLCWSPSLLKDLRKCSVSDSPNMFHLLNRPIYLLVKATLKANMVSPPPLPTHISCTSMLVTLRGHCIRYFLWHCDNALIMFSPYMSNSLFTCQGYILCSDTFRNNASFLCPHKVIFHFCAKSQLLRRWQNNKQLCFPLWTRYQQICLMVCGVDFSLWLVLASGQNITHEQCKNFQKYFYQSIYCNNIIAKVKYRCTKWYRKKTTVTCALLIRMNLDILS